VLVVLLRYVGPGGRTFYFNEESGFFQWERPPGVSSFKSASDVLHPPEKNTPGGVKGGEGGGEAGAGAEDPYDNDEEGEEEAWAYTDADATGEGGGAGSGATGGDGEEAVSPWAQYPDEGGNL